MTVTAEEKQQIKQKGYADIGGLKKNRYWTPDGREITAVPAMRDYNIIQNDKVISSGTRDANLDNGWLTLPPVEPKPYCPHCDKWHDTIKEVNECGEKKQVSAKRWEKLAKKMIKEENPNNDLREEVDGLKEDVSQIKDMLLQLLKKEK